MRRYTVHPDGTIEPHVLTCGQVAEIIGADESTVHRRAAHIPRAVCGGRPGRGHRVPLRHPAEHRWPHQPNHTRGSHPGCGVTG